MWKTEAFTFTDPDTGHTVRQLTASPNRSVHSYYDSPPWSPDGSKIAFTRMASSDASRGDVCIMNADGSNLLRVAESHRLTANDGSRVQWSGDGRRIYFNDTQDDQPCIGCHDVFTGETAREPGALRMVGPRGNQLVYHTIARDWPDDQLLIRRAEHGAFIKDMDSGDIRLVASVADCVTLHPDRDGVRNCHVFIKHTKWSPDGSRLLFVLTNEKAYMQRYHEARVKSLYVVDADGTNLRYIGEFGNHPIWHPDSRSILTNSRFHPDDPRLSLVLTDTETAERRVVTDKISGSGHPSFSPPDGRYVAIDRVDLQAMTGQILLLDVAADSMRHLVRIKLTDYSHTGTHIHPVWSRDGRQLLYASDASGAAQLCVVDVL